MQNFGLRQTRGYHYAGYTSYLGLFLFFFNYIAFSGPMAIVGILLSFVVYMIITTLILRFISKAKRCKNNMNNFAGQNILADIGIFIWLVIGSLVTAFIILDFIMNLFAI